MKLKKKKKKKKKKFILFIFFGKKSIESAPKFSDRSGNRKHSYFFLALSQGALKKSTFFTSENDVRMLKISSPDVLYFPQNKFTRHR